jgi:hypothetical protein
MHHPQPIHDRTAQRTYEGHCPLTEEISSWRWFIGNAKVCSRINTSYQPLLWHVSPRNSIDLEARSANIMAQRDFGPSIVLENESRVD